MPTSSPSRAAAVRARLLVLVVPERSRVVVVVAGRADRTTAPLLRDGLLGSLFYRPSSLVVDATELTSCDRDAGDALLDAVALVQRSGGQVTIDPSPQLAWLMADVRRATRTSGQPALDPSGCPLPRPSRQSA